MVHSEGMSRQPTETIRKVPVDDVGSTTGYEGRLGVRVNRDLGLEVDAAVPVCRS